MDVFAIPVLAEMDSTVTARKPCSRRSSKAVSMITVSISSARRRFTDLLSFSILFDIATPGPAQIEMQGSTARNYRCYDTVRSFKKIKCRFVMDGRCDGEHRGSRESRCRWIDLPFLLIVQRPCDLPRPCP